MRFYEEKLQNYHKRIKALNEELIHSKAKIDIWEGDFYSANDLKEVDCLNAQIFAWKKTWKLFPKRIHLC